MIGENQKRFQPGRSRNVRRGGGGITKGEVTAAIPSTTIEAGDWKKGGGKRIRSKDKPKKKESVNECSGRFRIGWEKRVSTNLEEDATKKKN